MELVLPATPASAREARRFVVSALHQHHREELSDVAELLASELVTNALLHAGTDIRVRVTVADGRVRIEVLDASPLPAARRHFGAEATTGRGLGLVEELAARWGTAAHDEGKVVWFELEESVSC